MKFQAPIAILTWGCLGLGACAANTADEVPAGYAVHQTVPLTRGAASFDGRLEILEDDRVTPALRQAMWANADDPTMHLGEKEPLYASFRATSIRPAHLRVIADDEAMILDETLTPLAEVKPITLADDSAQVFMVLSDHSVGMGSYAGVVTRFLQIRNGRPAFVQLTSEKGPRELSLVSSLKNGWRIVESASGRGQDIEVIQCHPNFDNSNRDKTGEFAVEYSTIHFDGKSWVEKTRKEFGFWEDEGEWPARAKFP